ncbi:hypothetical protein D0T25_27210 [Duganella sp. BJB488]|uniref:hypothetical protein n=1 Tax=unclassified Duganella TaxID=2636909 RepID=UPI000E34B507|nr:MULTISPECIES: hypothetical protein [unclassified Duganella]RFP10984.1 hypothetical protein D0T26_26085 [Duganella sp. BJB489]RFP14467.1 hypothetical protein D0T25_27210 [Duganella sp. BJB488]RFP30403.1 hypothetical protein D0T24_27910 [Duganella sp. BJB480]
MKIRCVIDGLTLHGMTLSPLERLQLERALQTQLTSALRAGWAGMTSGGSSPSPAHHLRIDLSHATAPLGHSLGQALGAALSPTAGAGAALRPPAGAGATLAPAAGTGDRTSAPAFARSR